jgi:hypothetical protein
MTDLVAIMGTLVDDQGRILIDGVYDDVAPLLPEEEKLYKCITFDTVRLIRILSLNDFSLFNRKLTVPKLVLTKQFKMVKKAF